MSLVLVIGAACKSSARRAHHLNTTHELQCIARESRANEDIVLLPLLLAATSNQPGSFVEIGANDGDEGSQTWLLEKCFGWRGVLIEGNPDTFAKLNRTQRSRGTRKVHSAVCDAGIGSIKMLSGLRCRQTAGTQCRPVVPCQPLTSIMSDVGFPRATFLSLDVEGAEELVLKTVVAGAAAPADFPFDIVLVEAERTSPDKNERVRGMLRKAGLVRLPIEYSPGSFNDLYARPALGDPRQPSSAMVAKASLPWLTPLLRSWPRSSWIDSQLNRSNSAFKLATRLTVGVPAALQAARIKMVGDR